MLTTLQKPSTRLAVTIATIAFIIASCATGEPQGPDAVPTAGISSSLIETEEASPTSLDPQSLSLECAGTDRAFGSFTPDAAERGSRSPLAAAQLGFESELIDGATIIPISALSFALVRADGTTVAIGDVIQLPSGGYFMTEVESCI